MLKKYKIANFNIELEFDGDEVFEQRLLSYESDFDKCDIKIRAVHTSGDIEIASKNIIKLSDIAYLYRTDTTDVVFYHDAVLNKVFAKLEFSKDYGDINITLYTLKKNLNVDDHLLLFNMMCKAMLYVSQMHGGFVFHSSSICYDGCGVAFSAKSGTGKSTHTGLWLKNFPEAFILNDDTPIIRRGDDGIFYICGTPWAGTTGINQNFVVPLKAIVFLERGIENSISTITPGEAIKPFFEGIVTPITDEMFSNCLDTLNELFLKVPVCRLKCNMDPSAAMVAKDFIYGIR